MTGTLLNSRRDERGGATVIGFVLLMGIIAMMILVQLTQVVPHEADKAEFEAGMGVVEDAEAFGEVIHTVDGETGVRVVTIGEPVDYPRIGGQWYPPGTIVRDVSSDQQVLVEGRHKRFETSGSLVSFQGQYTHRDGPRAVFEHGSVYTLTEDGEVIMHRDQRIVDGEEITVHTLSSSAASSSSQNSMAVSVYPEDVNKDVSFASKNNSGAIEIVLPTYRSESYWRDTYENELRSNGGYVTAIKYTERVGQPNVVEFNLKGGDNYTLSWRVVEVG